MRLRQMNGMKKAERQKGQASIMMGMMLLTFVFFFAFVVNIGMLVNAKINLQNAADLAAYAGASVQARQLTQISYLNYEMRRQYKKFIFRYYVLGNMAQRGFPTQGSGPGKTPKIWSPDNNPPGNPNINYQSPIVCLKFLPNDGSCAIGHPLPAIRAGGGGTFDSINKALDGVFQQIEQSRQRNCTLLGQANTQVLSNWLWNTDPDYSSTLNASSGLDANTLQILSVVKGLAKGIGLVPREIILKRRIDTLAEYLNQAPTHAMTLDQANQLSGQAIPEPAASERSIQAYLSAHYTLGENTFENTLTLDELMPPQQVRILPIEARFSAFAMDFTPSANGCNNELVQDGVSLPIPLGVYKDPSILTYYALRLHATAHLMFSPFGDLKLTAYAAARPFGSRIGPKLAESDFVRPAALTLPPSQASQSANSGLAALIPNLPLRGDDDTSGVGNGWDTLEAMGAMFQAFSPPNAPPGSMGTSLDEVSLHRAYHVAMAPNQYEAKKYNIPFDGDDPFVRNFDSNHMMAFWAPVFPLSKLGSLNTELESLLKNYLPTGTPAQQQSLLNARANFLAYMEQLKRGIGEPYDLNPNNAAGFCGNCEGFRIVRIADPVHTRPEAGPISTINTFGGLIMTDPKDFRTSWSDAWESKFSDPGRIGYSVKFVSFDSLTKGVQASRGQTSSNILTGDPELEQDIQFIKH